MRNLIKDTKGIILPGIIAISFIIMSSILWLAGALIVNKVYDAFQPILATCQPQALAISTNAVNAYGVTIIIIDGLLLLWWGLSASKTESQEYPGATF